MDFRPINLITNSYKIIAKVLSLQLREILESIISNEHATSIKGRQMLDAILVTNEVEKYRRNNKEA